MPQIAQQDYKIIASTPGRAAVNDAAVLGELKKSFLNGTIFDCIINQLFTPNVDGLSRVIAGKPSLFYLIDPEDGTISNFELLYTPTQYQGLAAVQAEVDRIDGVTDALPTFQAAGGVLIEADSGYAICTPEGYQYKVTLVKGRIATIEASTTKIEGDFIAINIEDAQKLIGLPCES